MFFSFYQFMHARTPPVVKVSTFVANRTDFPILITQMSRSITVARNLDDRAERSHWEISMKTPQQIRCTFAGNGRRHVVVLERNLTRNAPSLTLSENVTVSNFMRTSRKNETSVRHLPAIDVRCLNLHSVRFKT